MKNKFLFFILLTFAIMIIPNVSAFFTLDHEAWTIIGMETVSSSITQVCKPYLSQVVDGNTASDVPVLHYFDGKFLSYISTHTRGSGYWACLEAAKDQETRCMCVGVGLHIVQDMFSHTKGGLVPKYISKFFSSNLFGHMVIERDFETKHMQLLKDRQDSIITSGELQYYDSHALCTFMQPIPNSDGIIVCPDAPGDEKYAKTLEKMSGLNMINDLNIFQGGYLGKGFYNTVYNEKIQLPNWFWPLCIGLMIIGAGFSLFIGFTAKNKWKWLLITEFIIVFLIGGGIFFAYSTHNTWQITRLILEVPPKLGMLNVNQQDVIDYDNAVQAATNAFLTNGGQLLYDDATGLTYNDRNGNKVVGELTIAEKPFIFGLFPLTLAIFLAINAFLFIKAYDLKIGFRKK